MEAKDIGAVILIQRWFRKFKSKQELRKLLHWKIFDSIQRQEEHQYFRLQQFFDLFLQEVSENRTKVIQSLVHSSDGEEDEELPFKGDELPKPCHFTLTDHKGPRVILPLQPSSFTLLMHAFQSAQHLQPRYFCLLAHEAIQTLKRQPTIRRLTTGETQKYIVVGSLHGDIKSLSMIFNKNGLPAMGNLYVFLGNYVDLGRQSIEVLGLMLALIIIWPDYVTLLRGRHEDLVLNHKHGLYKEVKEKYKSSKICTMILRLVEEMYRWLPLGAVMDEDTFLVSGGVADQTDLSKLEALDRSKLWSLLQNPPVGKEASNDEMKTILDDWKTARTLLWSEPKRAHGVERTAVGSKFGPDVTDDFLKMNNLQQLVVSCRSFYEGYKSYHEGKCYGVFSSSNFKSGSNYGVYLKIEGKPSTITPMQFRKIRRSISGTAENHPSYAVDVEERAALRELQILMKNKQNEIMNHFNKLQKLSPDGKKGHVTQRQWCEVMSKSCSASIPWQLLCPHLTTKDPESGLIMMNSSFDRTLPKVDSGAPNQPVLSALYPHKDDIRTVFKLIDKDSSGYITTEELLSACQLLGQHMDIPLDPTEIQNIVKELDFNKDGAIDYNEFLEGFRLFEKQ